MMQPSFQWPKGFEPGSSRLYFRNARRIAAPVEQVWSWLVAAPLWPLWFPNATNVALPAGVSQLEAGTRFRWSQSGIALDSAIREFEPNRRLAWFATSRFVQAYHAWDLRSEESVVHVITDESQHGFMPTLLGPLLKARMVSIHDRWLAALERQAETGFARPIDRAP